MAQDIPKTTKQWKVTGTSGFDDLKLSEDPVPELGDGQVLVRSTFCLPPRVPLFPLLTPASQCAPHLST
jgi:NADPH-dependent curcumin reductase CurA